MLFCKSFHVSSECLQGLFIMVFKNCRGFGGKRRENDDRARFLNLFGIRYSTWTATKEVSHNHHQFFESFPWLRVNTCAKAVEVSSLQKSMKRETTVFRIVKMRYTAREINWFATRSQQVLSSQILNGEPHMM